MALRLIYPFPRQFDPQCFNFVLNFFRSAGEAFYGSAENPTGLLHAQQSLLDSSLNDFSPSQQTSSQNPLLTKQAIIVLREELEYFAIPPKGDAAHAASDDTGVANEHLLEVKKQCGQRLLEKKSIFTALQRNVNKENNVAEQHLIDMLCMRSV